MSAAVLMSSAQGTPQVRNPRVVTVQGPESFVSRVVADDLAAPWEVTWGPDGFLWITERVGKRVTRVNPTDGSRTVAVTIDEVYQTLAQDGLLGLALHPDLLKGKGTDYVYVAYTYDADPGSSVDRRMKVRRYTYEPPMQRLSSPVDILTGLPHGTDHGGGRMVFGPDGKLYLSRGDHGSNFLANYCDPNHAQDLPTAAQVQAADWSTVSGKDSAHQRRRIDPARQSDASTACAATSIPTGIAILRVSRLPATACSTPSTARASTMRSTSWSPGGNYGWPLIAGYQDDQSYVYANWSASSPQPCASLTFDVFNPPPSVPRQRESEAHVQNFVPPVKTFFTVPNSYDLRTLGNATVAPAGIKVYTSGAIPGWRNSLLMTTMISGVVFRMPLTGDRRNPVGAPVAYFKTGNRYRDIAVAPDGLRFYVATDPDGQGRTVDPSGVLTRELVNPDAVLEFKYTGAGK